MDKPWTNGDTLTFSSQMPVIAVTSGTANVEQPIRVIPALADLTPYDGAIDVLTFAPDGALKKSIGYTTSPYFVSTPGWTVDSSGTISDLGPSADRYKIFAEGYTSDSFSYIQGQRYIIAFLKSDFDGDDLEDEVDTDDDNDNYPDEVDDFPLDPYEWLDTDNDGIGNNADTDDDEDGLSDANDNCPEMANLDQADSDGDGIGDLCDDLSSTPGDINNDMTVDLKDLMITLKICKGIEPDTPVNLTAEVNGVYKISVEEAIYILEKVAGTRN